MRTWFQRHRRAFPKDNWTPKAVRVLATAKAIASPSAISPEHLVLALEGSDAVGARALKKIGVAPSVLLGRTPPDSLSPDGELLIGDFGPELRDLQRLACSEARSRKWDYLGTDALLLVIARIGVRGLDLSYEKISNIIMECR